MVCSVWAQEPYFRANVQLVPGWETVAENVIHGVRKGSWSPANEFGSMARREFVAPLKGRQRYCDLEKAYLW